MKINTTKWKEYRIGDLFNYCKGKTLSLKDKDIYIGDIPCINGATSNNGVFAYLSKDIEEIGFVLQKAPCITICRVGVSGYSCVQSSDFYIADNAYSLKLKFDKHANIFVYLFLSTILNRETYKYSYGRIINNNYFNTAIKLPAASDNSPDWAFMEQYIKTLHFKPITTKIKPKHIPLLKIGEWKEFLLGDLFAFYKGKRLTKQDMIEGHVNFLGAISENNGIRQLIDIEPMYKPNCITINYNGSVGEAFYQSSSFWASDDVNVLYAKDWTLNKYIALFITTVVKANRYKFSFGRKWTLDKMKVSAIKLPATAQGEPDWKYMEECIKALPYSDRI